MPRVNTIQKCRKSPGPCGRCGKPINPGDPYRYWEFRFGGKHVRCLAPECSPRPRDLTQSDFWIEVYDIQDELQAANSPEDVQSVIDRIRDHASEQEDKLTNMPEGLQQAPTGELLQGRADSLEEWASGLESIDEPDEEAEDQDDELVRYLDEVKALDYEGE